MSRIPYQNLPGTQEDEEYARAVHALKKFPQHSLSQWSCPEANSFHYHQAHVWMDVTVPTFCFGLPSRRFDEESK